MKVRCDECGREHDPLEMDPVKIRPDEIAALSAEERRLRVIEKPNWCILAGHGENRRKHYFRALLAVPILDLNDSCCWGAWAQVSEKTFEDVLARWPDPARATRAPVAATFANNIAGYPPLIGTPGQLGFRNVHEILYFSFDQTVTHIFAVESRVGVGSERVVEWLKPYLHRTARPRTTGG